MLPRTHSLPTLTYAQRSPQCNPQHNAPHSVLNNIGESDLAFQRSNSLPTHLNEMELRNCAICLKPLLDNVTVTPCNHEFHAQCLDAWLPIGGNCPNCRMLIGDTGTTEDEPEAAPTVPMPTVFEIWQHQVLDDLRSAHTVAVRMNTSLNTWLEQLELIRNDRHQDSNSLSSLSNRSRHIVASLISLQMFLESRVIQHIEVLDDISVVFPNQVRSFSRTVDNMAATVVNWQPVLAEPHTMTEGNIENIRGMTRSWGDILSVFHPLLNVTLP